MKKFILTLFLTMALAFTANAQINELRVRTTSATPSGTCQTDSRFGAVSFKFNTGFYQCLSGSWSFLSPTITGLVNGGILFGGADGTVTQNTPKFKIDNTNFRIGINNSTPLAPIHANISEVGQPVGKLMQFDEPMFAGTYGIVFRANSSNGTYSYHGLTAGTESLLPIMSFVRPSSSVSFGYFISTKGLITGLVTKTANYTATATDHTILVDSTSGVRTITLPTAIGVTGQEYIIKDWKGTSGTNNITIATTNSQTIDGTSTKTINTNYAALAFKSDGANWIAY